jgi:hypothetical protein
MTLEAFIKKWTGKKCDFDGKWPNECVDLYRWYVKEVLNLPQSPPVRGAYNIWNTYLKNHFSRITNTPEGVPHKGDIVIWNSQTGGGFGHVAIFVEGSVSKFTSFDANWNGRLPHLQNHYYKNVLGWLRPKSSIINDMKITNQTKIPQIKDWEVQKIKSELKAKDKRISELEKRVNSVQSSCDSRVTEAVELTKAKLLRFYDKELYRVNKEWKVKLETSKLRNIKGVSNVENAKQKIYSKTLWVAVVQGVVGVLAVFLSENPEFQGFGFLLTVKAILDGWLRLNTSRPLK